MKVITKLLLALCILTASVSTFAQNKMLVIPAAPRAKALLEEVQLNLIPRLSPKDQQYYAEFAKQIKWDEQNLPDLSDPNTMKAYLAFHKLKKYGRRVKTPKGRITEDSPLLGYSAVEFRALENSPYPLALSWLEKSIYTSVRFKIIPLSLQEEAQKLASDILYDTLQERFNMTPEQIEQFLETTLTNEEISNSVTTHNIDDKQNDWNLQISLNPQGFVSSTEFHPFGVMALHELLHVQNMFPANSNSMRSFFDCAELATSLQDIMLNDLIYKKLNNIPLEQTVVYETGGTLPIGEIAVFLHKLQQQYPEKNMSQLLVLPQLQEYIEQLYEKFR